MRDGFLVVGNLRAEKEPQRRQPAGSWSPPVSVPSRLARPSWIELVCPRLSRACLAVSLGFIREHICSRPAVKASKSACRRVDSGPGVRPVRQGDYLIIDHRLIGKRFERADQHREASREILPIA